MTGHGINIHIPSNSDVEKCKSMHCEWVRIDINWNQIEKAKGSFSWGSIDSAVSAAKAKGLHVYASLAYSPSWLTSDYRSCPDAANWSDFCTVAAEHFGGRIDVYGIWNEPNLSQFFRGSIDDYVENLLKPGYTAIKAVNGNLVVAGGELSTASNSSWTSWFSRMAKCKSFFDVFSWHVYQTSANDILLRYRYGKFPVIGWIIPRWRPISWYTGDIKSGKRMMITETGLKAKSSSKKELESQLDFVKDLDKVRKETKSEAIFYYDLKDNKQFKAKWGLFDDNGNPKPAASWMMEN